MGIALQIPGVALEIFPGAELQGIDEDTEQNSRRACGFRNGGPSQQLLVPPMQGAHGGHEMQWTGPEAPPPGRQLQTCTEQFHPQKSATAHPPDWRMGCRAIPGLPAGGRAGEESIQNFQSHLGQAAGGDTEFAGRTVG